MIERNRSDSTRGSGADDVYQTCGSSRADSDGISDPSSSSQNASSK